MVCPFLQSYLTQATLLPHTHLLNVLIGIAVYYIKNGHNAIALQGEQPIL